MSMNKQAQTENTKYTKDETTTFLKTQAENNITFNASTSVQYFVSVTYQNQEEEELHAAVYKRDYKRVIDILRGNSVNVDAHKIDLLTGNYTGPTPLEIALDYNDFEMCRILIGFGADFRNLSINAAVMLSDAITRNDKETIYSILDWYKLFENQNNLNDIEVSGDLSLPPEEDF